MKEFISFVAVCLASKAVSLSHGVSRTEIPSRGFGKPRTRAEKYRDSVRDFNEMCPEYKWYDNKHSSKDIMSALGTRRISSLPSSMGRDFPRLNPKPPSGSWLCETTDKPQAFKQFVKRARGMNALRDIKRGRNTLYLQPVGTLASVADLEDDAKLAEIEAKYGVRYLRFLRAEGWFLRRLKEYLSAFFLGMEVVVLDYVQLGQAVDYGTEMPNPGLRHGSATSSPSSQSKPSRRRCGGMSFLRSSWLSSKKRGNRSRSRSDPEVLAAPPEVLAAPVGADWMAVPTRDALEYAIRDPWSFDEMGETIPSHYQIEASVARTVLARLSTTRVVPYNGYAFLGVTMEDLYRDDNDEGLLNAERKEEDEVHSVAGLADMFIRVGIFSFYKFYMPERKIRPSKHGLPGVPFQEAVLEARLLKNACMTLSHEVAQTFGVQHCLHFNCLMQGAWNQDERDRRFHEVCPVCLKKLSFALRFDSVSRYKAIEGWAGDVLAEGGLGPPAVFAKDTRFETDTSVQDSGSRLAAAALVFGGWKKWFKRRAVARRSWGDGSEGSIGEMATNGVKDVGRLMKKGATRFVGGMFARALFR